MSLNDTEIDFFFSFKYMYFNTIINETIKIVDIVLIVTCIIVML